jgi:hypothetical protein
MSTSSRNAPVKSGIYYKYELNNKLKPVTDEQCLYAGLEVEKV